MSRHSYQGLDELAEELSGEVFTDDVSRKLYATDASPYQKLPLGVIRPRSPIDCVKLVHFAAERGIPLIPRGAGTSLAGQCVGEGLVVDFSRHLNQILVIEPAAGYGIVQPGVVPADLNARLKTDGLMFAPDPSTQNQCNIGGMVGNNAWGGHGVRYGTTRDHVIEIEAVLSDASIVRFGPVDDADLQRKLAAETLEGHIYRRVYHAIDRHRDTLLDRYPSARGIPSNSGYALDRLAQGRPWNPEGGPFNLAPFLCGSEGTLALITEITVNLVSIPKTRCLVCAHFRSVDEALRAVGSALDMVGLSAVELLDRELLQLTRHNPSQNRNRFWLDGDPGAVLLIEFSGEQDDVLTEQAHGLKQGLRKQGLGYAYPEFRGRQLEQVWDLRRAGLGLLMGMPGPRKAVTGIEDTAVAVADLPDYIGAVQALMRRLGIDCVMYGSVSMGLVHLRPKLDLSKRSERETFASLLDEIARLVAHFGGSISAKHGDGRLRAAWLEATLGKEVVDLLRAVKAVFDPEGIFNPHKILDPPPVLADLRAANEQSPGLKRTYFDWSSAYGLLGATKQCNGSGACRKSARQGDMCPSYMATREELDGTRGRANLLRQALSSADPRVAFTGDELYRALDLCLACKACKSECPANVDMARLKAEFLQHRHDRFGTPWRTRLIGRFTRLSRFASVAPDLSNRLLASSAVKRLLGMDHRRTLPTLAHTRFSRWFGDHRPSPEAGQRGQVVLLNDPHVEYYEPDIGCAAVDVLEHLGYRVLLTPCLSSGRVEISQGLLRAARSTLASSLERLRPYVLEGLPIVGLEPSELLTFRDEARDLVRGKGRRELAGKVAENTFLFEEFIVRQTDKGIWDSSRCEDGGQHVLAHVHCHQKALVGTQTSVDALTAIPAIAVEVIPSPCCGMAGSFGYAAEHDALSMAIGELVLFPTVRSATPGTVVVASGASCRQQIAHGTGVRALHPAQLMAQCLLALR